MAGEWDIIKNLYNGFGNNPANTELANTLTFRAPVMREFNPFVTFPRGVKSLSQVDPKSLGDFLMMKYQNSDTPRQDIQSAGQSASNLASGALDVLPMAGMASPVIKPTAKALGRELARQVETGTGFIGSNVIDPRMNIIAWHGSPAKFNKFDAKFAKTGAGAEQYGPGAYLSEGMELAKGYQPRSDAFENAISKLSERAYNTNNYSAADIYDNFLIHRTPEEVKSMIDEMYQGSEAIKAHQALKQAEQLYKTKSKGGLYKVDLPDEHLPYFVNWNEPISSQSSHIQDIAKKYGLSSEQKGENLISAAGGINEAPNSLMQHGVKGIKYFDTTSPGAGSGTHNYVVYDPNLIKILQRNGIDLP